MSDAERQLDAPKKKKKSKHREGNRVADSVLETQHEKGDSEDALPKKKKKRRKHDDERDGEDGADETDVQLKKKKKRKRDRDEETVDHVVSDAETRKTKKRKHKVVEEPGPVQLEDAGDPPVAEKKEKKKKKRGPEEPTAMEDVVVAHTQPVAVQLESGDAPVVEKMGKQKKRKHAEQPIATEEPVLPRAYPVTIQLEDGDAPAVKKKRKHQETLAADNEVAPQTYPVVVQLESVDAPVKKKRKHEVAAKDDDEKDELASDGDTVAEPKKKGKRRQEKRRADESMGPAPLLPLPSADELAALLPSAGNLGSTDDILRALQNADLATAIRSISDPPKIPTSMGANTSNEKNSRAKKKVSTTVKIKDLNTIDHAELLATKWLTTQQLNELAKTTGLVYKKGKFSAPEAKLASDAVDAYQKNNQLSDAAMDKLIYPEKQSKETFWFEISKAVPLRPVTAVYHHVRRARHPLKLQGRWTAEEDDKLIQAVASHGKKWEKISAFIGRLATDCRDRYRNYLKHRGTQTSGPWSKEEEEKLVSIILELHEGKDLDHGVPWTQVSERMGGTRGRQQCRMKWTDSLSVRHKTGGAGARWTKGDTQMLIQRVAAQPIQHETEIDWTALPEGTWNLWSNHILQLHWFTMKKGVKGYEDMTLTGTSALCLVPFRGITRRVELLAAMKAKNRKKAVLPSRSGPAEQPVASSSKSASVESSDDEDLSETEEDN
ncbi:Nucleolar protein [Mycena chlorophos]|uniref:Nucleolar protein n=1 Tax=Mycena chlorophos TaxID=658473 RepID=A0A8H6S3X6_MYCCL|nr:Nucleolar protein [Mycena chlorophos]